MLFLWLILIIIIGVYIKFCLHKRNLLKYVKHLPSYKEYPIIGSAYRFLGQNNTQIMKTFIDMNAEIETPARLWFGPQLVITIDKPDDIQAILNSPNCLEKSHVYKFLRNDLGLFSATTNLWKKDRKLLQPAFNIKILLSFTPIFNEKTNLMVKNMETELDTNRSFDVFKYVFECTLDLVIATSLGCNAGVQDNTNREYSKSWKKVIKMIAKRMFTVYWHPDFIYNWTKAYQLEKEQFDIAAGLPKMILEQKKKEFNKNKSLLINDETNEKVDENDNYVTPQILIDQLFKIYDKGLMTYEGVYHNVNLAIFGGTDTSALATSHAILLLAMHPEIQEKTFKEISEVYDSDDQYSDNEIVSQLNYTEMVLREAMRLFPVAPFLARKCLGDTKIANGCVIPKSTLLIISAWGVHRSEAIWGPNVLKFDPDNFLPEKVAARHPYSYMAFSAGPRYCLGVKYALASMKIMLAHLLRKYKFSTELKLEDITLKFEITMKLANKHMVKIERRNFKNKNN